MSLSAAKSRVLMARTQIETNRIDDVLPTLAAAERFLAELTDEEKAPVQADIQAIRAQLATMLTSEDERKLAGARNKLRQARSWLESSYAPSDIEPALRAAEDFLAEIAEVHAAHKAPLQADLASIRAALGGAAVPAPAPAPLPPPPPGPTPVAAPGPTPVAPPAPAPAPTSAPAATPQAAVDAAIDALRAAERDVMNERSFDAARFAPRHDAAAAAIAALAQVAPDHASLADLRRRFAEVEAKADAIVLDAVRMPIDSARRAVERELAALASARAQTKPKEIDPAHTAGKLREWADKVRAELDSARPRLTSDRARAAVAEIEAWLAGVDRQVAELGVLALAFARYRDEVDVQDLGRIKLDTALDSVEWNFSRDPERVVLAWDAAKKLIGGLQDPRFAGIAEVDATLARYRALEARVATELRPLLAARRVRPLIEKASHWVALVERDTDAQDLDKVIGWRASLREAIAPLAGEWADDPDAKAFLARCARVLARSEEEFGDGLILREIQAAERFVKPLVERVERALVLGSAVRVREHAPRLRARLGALAPFLSRQRAELLDRRARTALDRVEAVLGAEVAREVAAAEEVPHFEIDVAADTRIQAVLRDLDQALDAYRAEHAKAQAQLEERVDVVAGVAGYGAQGDVDGASRTMIRLARQAEDVLDRLRAIDAAHPAIAVVEAAAPALVARAQAWRARAAQRIEYATAIGQARGHLADAERHRATATGGDAFDAIRAWPEALAAAARATEAIAAACAALPDDHDEADALAAAVAAIRDDAGAELPAICLAEATRRAIANDAAGAATFAAALRQTLPDAPQNAQIAAAIAGTADARQAAQAEIRERAELLVRRAQEAAAALRPAFDAWVAARKPRTLLAGTIVHDLERHRGAWIEARTSSLGVVLYDEPRELDGDIFQIDYDPEVRAQIEAGMTRLNALYAQMVEQVGARHGVAGLPTFTQHTARDARYVAEVVGLAQYTPRREIRDRDGRLVGTIEGTPYPVPRVVIRAVASAAFVVVPGHPPSLDAMTTDGVLA